MLGWSLAKPNTKYECTTLYVMCLGAWLLPHVTLEVHVKYLEQFKQYNKAKEVLNSQQILKILKDVMSTHSTWHVC